MRPDRPGQSPGFATALLYRRQWDFCRSLRCQRSKVDIEKERNWAIGNIGLAAPH